MRAHFRITFSDTATVLQEWHIEPSMGNVMGICLSTSALIRNIVGLTFVLYC